MSALAAKRSKPSASGLPGVACATALTLLLAAQLVAAAGLEKRKLGPNINTAARELVALPSPDGTLLYILREDEPLTAAETQAVKARTAGVDTMCLQVEAMAKLPRGTVPEDLLADLRKSCETAGAKARTLESGALGPRQTPQRMFVSRRQANGDWGKAEPLALRSVGPLSTYVIAVLPDNNTLALFGQFNDDRPECLLPLGISTAQKGRCTPFWLTQRRGTGWEPPQRLEVAEFGTGAARTSAALVPSLGGIVLDLQRPGGQGLRDLYLAKATGERTFSRPVSLGKGVNTAANDIDPTLAADGKTLYFASDRPGGLGGLDLYVTRRLDESWQRWSPPRNLGPDINTPRDDVSITVDASGLFAYQSIENVQGNEDIWEFALPAELRPGPVAFVYGKVQDPAGAPVAAAIFYERLRDGRPLGRAGANLKTGDYQIALPIGEQYGFRASAKGYVPVSDNIDLRAAKVGARYRRDLQLVPLATGSRIRLNNLFFDFNKAELLPESTAELDRLVALMQDTPSLRIRIEAHTDSVGTDAANVVLSSARAKAVSAYLGAARISASRVESRGFGESAPAAGNDTEEGRALNRRVEFRVLDLKGDGE